jgi:hypothetical protein
MGVLTPKNSNANVPPWFKAVFSLPARDEAAYYAAVGEFILAYAAAEAALHLAVRHFSGLDDANARIVFAGMRLKDLSERLRALTRSKPKDHEEIDYLLVQLDLIREERDKLVHRRVEFDVNVGFKASNKLMAKSEEHAEEKIFDLVELVDMEQDCQAIFYRLCVKAEQLDVATLKNLSLLSAYAAWRYKPSQQDRKQKQRPPNRQSRKRQRRASLASPTPPRSESR